jgi:predicted RNA-binding protein
MIPDDHYPRKRDFKGKKENELTPEQKDSQEKYKKEKEKLEKEKSDLIAKHLVQVKEKVKERNLRRLVKDVQLTKE